MGCRSSHMADFDRADVASSLATNSRFDSSANSTAVSRPSPIMYTDWAVVSWMVWESSIRSRCSSRSRATASCRRTLSDLESRLTDATTAYMTKILAMTVFSSLASKSRPGGTPRLTNA